MKSLKLSHWGMQYLELQSFDDHFIIKDRKKFSIVMMALALLSYILLTFWTLYDNNFEFSKANHLIMMSVCYFGILIGLVVKNRSLAKRIDKKDIIEITQNKSLFGNQEQFIIHYQNKKREFAVNDKDSLLVWQFFRENRN